MDVQIEFPDGSGYGEVACPHCGAIENLDWSIEENWECPQCDQEYWITPARLVWPGDPGLVGVDELKIEVNQPAH
jgi:uncharacterized Zn-finger protein